MEPLSLETKYTGKRQLRIGRFAIICLLVLCFLGQDLPLAEANSKKGPERPRPNTPDPNWQNPDWWQQPWVTESKDPEVERQALYKLLHIVRQTKFGRKLIKTAFKRYTKFYERINVGERSFTESTYSRTYSLKDGSEELEIENHLTINRDLPRIDAVYDLTHELVHFLFRKPHNPYQMEFSMPEFVRHGIEGKGGELQAFEAECHIAWEIERKAKVEPHRLCGKYEIAKAKRKKKHWSAAFNRKRAGKDFYAVGNYYVTLQGLQIELPSLSNLHPVFISSLENSPYPYALIQEFVNVRKMACENNVRKARLIQQQAARAREGRDPAADISSLSKEYKRLSKYFRRHCQTELPKN